MRCASAVMIMIAAVAVACRCVTGGVRETAGDPNAVLVARLDALLCAVVFEAHAAEAMSADVVEGKKLAALSRKYYSAWLNPRGPVHHGESWEDERKMRSLPFLMSDAFTKYTASRYRADILIALNELDQEMGRRGEGVTGQNFGCER